MSPEANMCMVSLISYIKGYIHPILFVQAPDQFKAFFNPKNALEKKIKISFRHILVNLKNVRVLAPRMLFSIGFWRQCQPLAFPPIQASIGALFSSFCLFFILSSGGWVKLKLKLPHFHVSDTCRVSI